MKRFSIKILNIIINYFITCTSKKISGQLQLLNSISHITNCSSFPFKKKKKSSNTAKIALRFLLLKKTFKHGYKAGIIKKAFILT